MGSNEIKVESLMERKQAVHYLGETVAALRAGRITIEHDERSLAMDLPDEIGVKISAERKRDKGEITVKLSWRNTPAPERAPDLQIRSSATPAMSAAHD